MTSRISENLSRWWATPIPRETPTTMMLRPKDDEPVDDLEPPVVREPDDE